MATDGDDYRDHHDRVAAFALLLTEKYGSRCKSLEEEHLDQAIEQEVRWHFSLMRRNCR